MPFILKCNVMLLGRLERNGHLTPKSAVNHTDSCIQSVPLMNTELNDWELFQDAPIYPSAFVGEPFVLSHDQYMRVKSSRCTFKTLIYVSIRLCSRGWQATAAAAIGKPKSLCGQSIRIGKHTSCTLLEWYFYL